MTNLLKAMSFWIWGLLAIGLSISVLTLSHRIDIFSHLSMSQEPPASSDSKDSNSARSNAQNHDEPTTPGVAVSAAIRPQLISARRALKAEQWSFALQILDAAENNTSGPSLVPPDLGSIAYLQAFAFLKLHRSRPAQDAYEKALANGAVPAPQVVAVLETLMRLAADNDDRQKSVIYSRKLAALSNLTPKDYETAASSFSVLRDASNGMIWCDKAIAASREIGSKPSENVLRYKLQFAIQNGDRALTLSVLFDLIRSYERTQDWHVLLRVEREDAHDDKTVMMIERLMYDTGAMHSDTDFIELAQRLSDAGFTQEALMVLNNVKESTLAGIYLERFARLRAKLVQRSETEPETVSIDAARQLLLANASERERARFGAPTDIERTLSSKQTDQPGELNLYVARVLARQGDTMGARAALNKFTELSTPTVASLWKLYADTLPEPENPS
jgi:hypothetical protein